MTSESSGQLKVTLKLATEGTLQIMSLSVPSVTIPPSNPGANFTNLSNPGHVGKCFCQILPRWLPSDSLLTFAPLSRSQSFIKVKESCFVIHKFDANESR